MDYGNPDTQPSPGHSPGGYPPPAARDRAHPPISATAMQTCLVAGCVTLLVPVLIVFGFFATAIYMISSGMEETSGFGSLVPVSGSANLREKLVREGDSGAGTIAIVNIQGVIDGDGSPIEGDGALAFVADQMRAAGEDARVKAVILQIDSPGGGLTASDQLYNEVLSLKAKNKIVLAWAGNLMASGGYYVAVGADGIMASPTSTVGSIGVIMRHFLIRDMLDKLGISSDPIVSGERKDIGSPFREMTPEERKLLQDYIDASHRRFVDIVAKGRNMDAEAVAKLADGSIFTAADAKEHGLVDRIGYIGDALDWAQEKAGEKNMRVVSYKRMLGFGELFREAGRGAAAAAIESAESKAAGSPPRAMAVWEGK